MTRNSETFVTVTNKDIYDKLNELDRKNTLEHSQIMARQDKTNGSVKTSRWIATTAISLTVILLGFIFQHISKIGG